ncbi:MAG: GntR family transcriptional regulator [Halocynthiibacter sp.]
MNTNKNSPNIQRVAKPPAHELVYQKIREMILFGELAPGQAVTIQGLAELLNAGMTPVREAIRRLIAGGALEFLGNRRVLVPELTLDQLDQLSFARLKIEPRLAYLAALNLTDADIASLAAIDSTLNTAIERGDVRGYLESNYRFHAKIYDRADASILREIADGLWLRSGPSLRVVCGRFGTFNLPDRHEDALVAIRARNPKALSHAITEDLKQGFEQIKQSFLSTES